MRKPISPRAGTRYSIRAQPVPWLTICCIRPFRSASICVTTPMYSSGTSIATRSTGSCFLPSISRVSTSGLPTVSSNPSRRMISTRTASWSSPRPCTSQTSGLAVGWTRRETFPTSSCSSRAMQRARRHLVAFGSGERGRVDPQGHGQGRLVDGAHRKRPRIVGIRDRLADRHVGQAGERHDLAGAGFVGGDAVERLRDVELGHAAPSRSSRRPGTRRPARPCGSSRAGLAARRGGPRTAMRRGS